jgi:2-hydroxy-6-oxo-6-(2'-aminophenyl)hexa-2,4-dienoate hydrolase
MRVMVDTLTGDGFEVDDDLLRYRFELTQRPGAMAAYGATMKWIGERGGLFYPEEEIAQVRTPTLIVNGRDDQVVPKELAWRFLELLDNSWLHLIPHCGHWVMVEHSEEFIRLVELFTDLLDRAAGAEAS